MLNLSKKIPNLFWKEVLFSWTKVKNLTSNHKENQQKHEYYQKHEHYYKHEHYHKHEHYYNS